MISYKTGIGCIVVFLAIHSMHADSYCTLIDKLTENRDALLRDFLWKSELLNPLYCAEKVTDENSHLSFPLFEAAKTSAILVQRLLDHGAQKTINRKSAPMGLTPLMMAAKSCLHNSEAPVIVKMLLEYKADPNLKTNEIVKNAQKTAYDFAKKELDFARDTSAQTRASCQLVFDLLKDMTTV